VGPFEDGIQQIDKQDIKDKLEAEAKEKCLQLCPMFSLRRMFQFVDMLPDSIDPNKDPEWEYLLSEAPETRGDKIGVKPKIVFTPSEL